MSLRTVSKEGKGDEYYTPRYVVEILLPHLAERDDIKTIWCPCDKESSEYVKVFRDAGYKVISSHIDEGKDFLEYEPNEDYDAIITNPPFSIKNQIVQRCVDLGKPWALLLSATSVQSASLIKILAQCNDINFIMFDKRISYSGDRPPFPSWYFSDGIVSKNRVYVYEENPKKLYKDWIESLPSNGEGE